MFGMGHGGWMAGGGFAVLLWWLVPIALLAVARSRPQADHAALLLAAFAVQYAGLLAERWFFFAQARHPQNLYYQAVS